MKRITLFAGHYGSGKTNVALGFARRIKRTGADVIIADLDIVNPYFRTKDSADALADEGIGLVVSDYANSNVDFPAMPKEIYALVAPESNMHVVMDIGGDDRGALALGRYVPDIVAGGDYDMLAVVNRSRPLTRTPTAAIDTLHEIETACGLRFTGIVNNTNLGPDTTIACVLDSCTYANEIANALGVRLAFTSVDERLVGALNGKIPNLMPLQLQRLYYQFDHT